MAEIRLLLLRSARSHFRLRLVLVGLLVLLGLVSVGFVVLWRRRFGPATPAYGHNGVYIPKNMPTGLSLEELTRRFQAAVEPELLGSRLAYLYAVLFDPDSSPTC